MDRVKRQIHYWCKDTLEGTFLGKYITTAVFDTGLYPHPDLAGRVLAFQDYINGRNGLYDDSGHGTHVAGILAGDGRMSKGILAGIAPESNLVVLKVLDQNGNGNVSHIEEAIQWVRKNKERYRIRIMNLSAGASIGIGEKKEQILIQAVEELWDMGICVVVSAGNTANKEEITIPGTSSKIITVGTSNYEIRAAQYRERKKEPDVLAPGRQIISCNAMTEKNKRPYVIKSGTSMATPVVSGVAALFLAKNPEISCQKIKEVLKNGELNVSKILEEK